MGGEGTRPLVVDIKTLRLSHMKYDLRLLLLFFFPFFTCSEFPPITNEQERNNYKREFDRDHQEYKDLQAELDAVNKNLSAVDKELDELEEGSPQYLVRPLTGFDWPSAL